MTTDALILDALRVTPLTGSEIGKGFAPEHIKDRAGWGRKWLARNADAHGLMQSDGRWTAPPDGYNTGDGSDTNVSTGPDFTIWSVLMDTLRFPDVLPRSYKHILAPRGTPPRPHFPRATRRFRFCNN